MTRRTYWHLESLRRKPGDYDVATSRVLYAAGRRPEVRTPLVAWYDRHQGGSPLRCRDWELFRDPRETTYASYVEQQRDREVFVDGILAMIEATGYDQRLAPGWVTALDALLSPLRYPVHGLQMIASYVGTMAPGGRVVVACLLQAGNEIRRIHRLAQRTRQLQVSHPGFGDGARAAWERDPRWQPLRRLVEELLVTYDWGEALVALNAVVKPAVDELFMAHVGRLALGQGDEALHKIFLSLHEDGRWQQSWTAALLGMCVRDDAGSARAAAGWIDKWLPRARAAVEAWAPDLADDPWPAVAARLDDHWSSCGVNHGSPA